MMCRFMQWAGPSSNSRRMASTIPLPFSAVSSRANVLARGLAKRIRGSMPGPPGKGIPMRLWPVCSGSRPG